MSSALLWIEVVENQLKNDMKLSFSNVEKEEKKKKKHLITRLYPPKIETPAPSLGRKLHS
jgi:hypothetical protein